MKIIISCIPYDKGKSGISVYIRNVVNALHKQGHFLTLIVEPDAAGDFAEFDKIVVPGWTGRPVFSMLYHLLILPWLIDWKKYDFCIVSAANRRIFCRCPVFTIATVHDLSQYHVAGKYDFFRMFYIRHVLPFFVRRADRVLAVSRSTASDLHKFWRIPEEKTVVAYNGLSLDFPTSGKGDFLKRHGIERPYILYISRLEYPGKNHLNLIRAFEKLPPELREKYDLLLPGADWNGAALIHMAAEKSPCREHIHLTGFAERADLPELYSHAACYVFPSLFEGFGLSLAEAMHFGVPCCCSATSSLGEIGGNGAAVLFDPADSSDISSAIASILQDGRLRASLIEAGRKRLADFSWEKHAEIICRTFAQWDYGEVFGVRFATERMSEALAQVENMIAQPKQSVAFFVNVHCLNIACKDREYRDILNRADRVWADGSGVAWAGKVLNYRVRENVNGTDMYPLLCQMKYSICLLGAAPGVAEQAAKRTRELYPQANIAGAFHGYWRSSGEESEIISRINSLAPDILLVALGVPRQEKWIARHRESLNAKLIIGVGGLLDFTSGRIPRAPIFMRRMGMEWLYRLYQEPGRLFRRYVIGNPVFIWRVLNEEE